MATHVLKYYKFATYHSQVVDKIYKTYIGKMSPKSGAFSVLDIGVGDGKILNDVLVPLLPENCDEVVATDIDQDMLEYCRGLKSVRNIHYQQLDAATENLPECMKNRFCSIFSSFCFMYVRNIRQGLLNCSSMLKRDGNVLLIFYPRKNPLFDTYSEMSKIEAWKPYLHDFRSYKSHLSSEDPHSEANKLFDDAGLKLMNMEIQDDPFESNRRNFLEINRSMDYVFRMIPEGKRNSYMKDFKRTLSDIFGVDLMDEKKLDTTISMSIPFVVLHGRKI